MGPDHNRCVIMFALLGLVAGLLTTVAGMGGGLFLLMTIGLWLGPLEALVVTTPALLLSNLHRLWMFRTDLDRPLVARIAIGVVPGALLGALALPAIPELVVALLFTASSVVAVLRSLGKLDLGWLARWIPGFAAVIGALAATSGGAAMLMAPLVLAAGATGTRYVATIAAAAAIMHAARVAGYGGIGLVAMPQLVDAAIILAGLLVGNLAGKRLRAHTGGPLEKKLELAALLAANAFALATVFTAR